MTSYAFPDIRPTSQRWSMQNFTAVFPSPLNGSISTQDRDGESWRLDMSWEDISSTRRRQLLAFLYKLNGSQHRFTVRDFAFVRAGVGGGTPLVNGAAQTGKNLIIDGGPTSVTGWLLSGDQIGVAGLMHSVDADVDTDGSGDATIIVSPRIFVAPNDNDAVEIDQPTNSFLLDVESIDAATRSTVSSVSLSAQSSL
jgi:hypothetical protein